MFSLSPQQEVKAQNFAFQFYDETFNFYTDESVHIPFNNGLSAASIIQFYSQLNKGKYQSIIQTLVQYKEKKQLNDWFYYQLIRKTAQEISPKEENYERYTLYKWFLLAKSGYDTRLAIGPGQLLFYVWSDEDIADIPYYLDGNKQLVCLNFHDYKQADYSKDKIIPVKIFIAEADKAFSYKVTQIPDFKPEDYREKLLAFNYKQKAYHFKIKLNADMQAMFKNYPGVNFESYFNIPLSRETYSSLIPYLKQHLKGMSQKKGVDYLMRFTRNAFLYENDKLNFGKEKRLSPEQTLFQEYSDCDDRVALFFYLVKEIYNLPMIALLYPSHITMAVKFDKPVGSAIEYKGEKYSVCEPTPQKKDLKIGQLSPEFQHQNFQVVYQYHPESTNN
jgi:hypothetical protein